MGLTDQLTHASQLFVYANWYYVKGKYSERCELLEGAKFNLNVSVICNCSKEYISYEVKVYYACKQNQMTAFFREIFRYTFKSIVI